MVKHKYWYGIWRISGWNAAWILAFCVVLLERT